jgi:hypothetical protein
MALRINGLLIVFCWLKIPSSEGAPANSAMHIRAAQDRKFLDHLSAYGISWYLLMWQYATLFVYGFIASALAFNIYIFFNFISWRNSP